MHNYIIEYLFYFTISSLVQFGFDDNISQDQINRITVNLQSMSRFDHIQTKSSGFHLCPKLTHH